MASPWISVWLVTKLGTDFLQIVLTEKCHNYTANAIKPTPVFNLQALSSSLYRRVLQSSESHNLPTRDLELLKSSMDVSSQDHVRAHVFVCRIPFESRAADRIEDNGDVYLSRRWSCTMVYNVSEKFSNSQRTPLQSMRPLSAQFRPHFASRRTVQSELIGQQTSSQKHANQMSAQRLQGVNRQLETWKGNNPTRLGKVDRCSDIAHFITLRSVCIT